MLNQQFITIYAVAEKNLRSAPVTPPYHIIFIMKRKTKKRSMKKWKEGGEHISNFNTIIETDNKEDLDFVYTVIIFEKIFER